MSEESTFALSNAGDIQTHTFWSGRTGNGRSAIIMKQAQQEDISYEEMEERLRPTKELEAAWEKERLAEEKKAEKRLQSVRDAYWDNSIESDFNCIHDAIDQFFDLNSSVDQLRKVFNLLPEAIIGAGIQWGFDETEVRGQIVEFIEENKVLVGETIK